MFPDEKYHITVFQDEWDNYSKLTNLPYHLFHLTENKFENKCSTFLWIDKDMLIKDIPQEYFIYNQPEHDYHRSTRTKCNSNDTKTIIKKFQKILKKSN
jgi:hypothetical protein